MPGLLGARHRQRPRGPAAAAPSPTATPSTASTLDHQRAEGVDEPGAVLRPLRAADAYRPARLAPSRHHRVLRRHGLAGHHGRAARDDQRRARVRRGVLRRRRRARRPHARRAARRVGGRDEHPPVRAFVVLLAADRVPVPAAPAARRRRRPTTTAPREVLGDAFVQLHALRARSRATQHRLAGGRDARRGDLDRQGARRDGRAGDYDAVRRAPARRRRRSTTRRPATMWRSEYLYSRAATIYGGTAEVQRNIIARRLLDLGSDD